MASPRRVGNTALHDRPFDRGRHSDPGHTVGEGESEPALFERHAARRQMGFLDGATDGLAGWLVEVSRVGE